MKIHEYQAKSLLKKYQIPIQDGVTIENTSEAEQAVDQVSQDLDTNQFVVKAQIHAGGRGKGGGVKFTPSKEEAIGILCILTYIFLCFFCQYDCKFRF